MPKQRVADPVDIVEQLGERGSLYIAYPATWHYLTPRSTLLASADGLFVAIREGVTESSISKTFPLSEVAEAHRLVETRTAVVLVPQSHCEDTLQC